MATARDPYGLGMKYIIRKEHPSLASGYYQVRFLRGTHSKRESCSMVAQRCFADLQHGGKRKALAAAKEYRDKMVIELGKIQKPNLQWRHYKTRPRSNTGIVGVSICSPCRPDGTVRHYVSACWMQLDENTGRRRQRNKQVSYNPDEPWTLERALRICKRVRRDMEKTHYAGSHKKGLAKR